MDNKKTTVVTERATPHRSYVTVTKDGNPIQGNRRDIVSLPQTFQHELPHKRRQPHHLNHHRSMDPQIAKHQPMMSKQPDLGGWLGHQSLLTYNTFCFVLIDVTLRNRI